MKSLLNNTDFAKSNGLIPAIIQNNQTKQVLMLGYMNKESLQKTLKAKKVWFYSRSKKRLWMKGETSGNTLEFIDAELDCDNDAILISVIPKGATCHTGQTSCFGEEESIYFLQYLFKLIQKRKKEPSEGSYTTSLFKEGLDRIVQKVGEEATEVVIAAKNKSKKRIIEESSDLLFHLFVLLAEKEISLDSILEELESRHNEK